MKYDLKDLTVKMGEAIARLNTAIAQYNEAIAQYGEAIAEYDDEIKTHDAFMAEYGLTDAFRKFELARKSDMDIEAAKARLDEERDTGGNYGEADKADELEEEAKRREAEEKEEESREEETDRKEEQEREERRREEEKDENPYQREYEEALKNEIPSLLMGFGLIGLNTAILASVSSVSEEEDRISFEYKFLNEEGPDKTSQLDLKTGHLILPETERRYEKDILAALAYAIKKLPYEGGSRQIKNLFAPMERLNDYVLSSRSSYDLFAALHFSRMMELAENERMPWPDCMELAENEECDAIYKALKDKDVRPLEDAYGRLKKATEAVIMNRKGAEVGMLSFSKPKPDMSDPAYRFENLHEVRRHAASMKSRYSLPETDRKKKKPMKR